MLTSSEKTAIPTLEQFKLPSRRIVIGVIIFAIISMLGVCVFLIQLHYVATQDVAIHNLQNVWIVEEQFNRHLFKDLDDSLVTLVSDLGKNDFSIDNTLAYSEVIQNNLILDSLQILDKAGRVLWASHPELMPQTNEADRVYYTTDPDGFSIHPPESNSQGQPTIFMSRGAYDNTNTLQYVVVAGILASQWSDMLTPFVNHDDYLGIVIDDLGNILTTFPYQDTLVGTQLTQEQLATFSQNQDAKQILPSLVDSNRSAFITMQPADDIPIHLIIEYIPSEGFFPLDDVVRIILAIALMMIISGSAIIVLYLYQYHLIRLQTNVLYQTSQNLKQEITVRAQTEASLTESEQRHRIITELVSDYAFITIRHEDGKRTREWLTDSFYTITGYKSELDSGFISNTKSKVHPDDLKQVEEDIQRSDEGEETVTEYRWRTSSGDYIWVRVKRYPIWDKKHKRVTQVIGTITDITAEKEAEIALRESEDRYRLITELISDYAYSTVINEDGTGVREWLTDSFYTSPVYQPQPLGSVPQPEQGTHPDDITLVEESIKQTIAGEETVTEYRWLTGEKDNYIWLRVKRHPIWNDNHTRVIRIIGAVTNITAEKEAEIALRESEDRYRLVTEMISDYAYSVVVYEDGSMFREWITDSFYTMTGYTRDSVGTVPQPEERTYPDDLVRVKADIERTIQGEETISEYRWLSAFDEYIWLRVKRRPVWNEDHTRVIKMIGAVSDITAEKEAEFALRESENRYRKVAELISDYAFSINVNADGSLERNWLTPSYYRLMGYTDEDLDENFSLRVMVHPDDESLAIADLNRVIQGDTVTTEFRARTKSGQYIWLQLSRQPVWDDEQDRVVSYYGIARDITAEKLALNALQESEERYRIVSELISDGAFRVDILPNGTLDPVWLTPSLFRGTGYTEADISEIVSGKFTTHPDDLEAEFEDMERVKAGETVTSVHRGRDKDGKYRWIRTTRQPIWDDDEGHVVGYYGVTHDVTAEKEATLALQKSEYRYRQISSILTDLAYEAVFQPDGTIYYEWVVGSIENVNLKTGLVAPIEQLAINAHPDDISIVRADILRTKDNVRTTTEYRIRTDDGYRWVSAIREPIWDEAEQQVVRFLGTIRDITLEKAAEQALAASQQQYREVTELMSDYAFSIVFGEEIKINWIVGSVEQITGVTSQEAMQHPRNLEMVAHPDDKPFLDKDVEKTRRGKKSNSEYRIIHAQTKEIRWLRVSRKPIWNKDRTAVSRVLVGATDITAEKETEVALRESEDRYRMVSELISDYVFSLKLHEDFSTEVEWVAGASDKLNNSDLKDLLGLDQLSHITHPDDYAQVMEDILKTNYGETTVSEYRVLSDDGQTMRWLRVSRQPLWNDKQDRVTHIIGAVSDVTVQKSTEDALRESEDRYRQVTELISDYVYSLSVLPDNRLKMDWFAGSFERITGSSISTFIVESPKDMIKGAHPEDYDDALSKIEQTMSGQATISEYRITNVTDNKPRWIQSSRFPIRDEKTGKVVRILGAVTDRTAQKLAELALRDSEERYRMLTELMTDYAFSIRFEEDGRLYQEWLVGDFESVMGYSIPSTAYFDHKNDYFSKYDTNIEAVQNDIQRVKYGETITSEYQITNKQDNQPRWIRTTRQPIWNKDHTKVIRYLGAVKDITLEKQAEVVSREANELRQALDREKGLHALRSRFVSMVTHEFRNPLAAILSSVSILDKYDDRLTEESRQEKFERIYGQVTRMTNLLEDLLEVGELEHRALSFSPQRVDLIYLIDDLYIEYRESIGSQHNLILDSKRDKVYTYADVQILRQALGNIISNAIKYSSSGSKVVCKIQLESDQILIHVIDEGMGIPKEEYDELFQAFYRASNVTTFPGTGLGLLIAKQSIELHKGTIDFTSEVGKGTTFIITLPWIIGKKDDT